MSLTEKLHIQEDDREILRKRGHVLRRRRFSREARVVSKYISVCLLHENGHKPSKNFLRNTTDKLTKLYGAVPIDLEGFYFRVPIGDDTDANSLMRELLTDLHVPQVTFADIGRVFEALGNGEQRKINYGKELRKYYRENRVMLEKMLSLATHYMHTNQPTAFSYVEFQEMPKWVSLEGIRISIVGDAQQVLISLGRVLGEFITLESAQWDEDSYTILGEYYGKHSLPPDKYPISHPFFQQFVCDRIAWEDRCYAQELFRCYNLAKAWYDNTEKQANARYCPHCKAYTDEAFCPLIVSRHGKQEVCNRLTLDGSNRVPADQKEKFKQPFFRGVDR